MCKHFQLVWAGALVQRLKLPVWKVKGDRGFKPHSGLQVSKKHIPARFNIVGSLSDREAA